MELPRDPAGPPLDICPETCRTPAGKVSARASIQRGVRQPRDGSHRGSITDEGTKSWCVGTTEQDSAAGGVTPRHWRRHGGVWGALC